MKLSTTHPQESAEWRRTRAHEEYLRPALLFQPTLLGLTQWMSSDYNRTGGALAEDLPANVNVMTLDRMRDGSPEVLLRLEHLFAPGEHPVWSRDVNISLSALFADQVRGGGGGERFIILF